MIKRAAWVMFFLAALAFWSFASQTMVQKKLKYSCSAQVFEAFEKERLETFTQTTGIEVDLYVTSSLAAVNRLLAGESDIASVARWGTYPLQEGGYLETPFCLDPLVVIINARNRLANLTEEQLRNIFNRKITNWNELGGRDETIILVVPGKNTAAHETFGRLALKRKEIEYDIMTHRSALALEAVKRFPAAVSFVTQGTIGKAGGVKTVRINGLSPKDKGYPYLQKFSYVTKGKPAGPAKAFVDFTLSEQGKEIINKRGMKPIGPKE
ncbi:MAG: substrate-binding domain-containing protein [Deltaproteobacteria bacterium]|nr:substrate-binding domain-containing protein [Deltaproteobacteria bacterium]